MQYRNDFIDRMQVAELIASEFFEQGDIEKRDLNMKPFDVMDRDKASELPRMQIGFIDGCLPVYKVTVSLLGVIIKPIILNSDIVG